MRYRRLIALFATLLFFGTSLPAAKKKKNSKDELPDQTLQLPKELPLAATGETARLVYRVTPLTNKGLLSHQVREGLKSVLKDAGNNPVIHLRAFVAGTGDMRRVPAIVSETFTARKLPLPALTVVQVGALPLEGSQVVIESVSMSKKPVNPNGIAFIAGRSESSTDPLDPVAPLAEKVLPRLRAAIGSSEVLSVTCFVSALDTTTVRNVRSAFPKVAVNVLQPVRAPSSAIFGCEAVTRLETAPAIAVEIADRVVKLNVPRLVFSSSQLAFHTKDSDISLAFKRLDKALATNQASLAGIVYARFYSLTRGIAERLGKAQIESFNKARPPASTTLLSEGLPSLDASFGVDVVAVK